MTAFKASLRLLGHKTYSDYLKSSHWESFKNDYRTSGLSITCSVCGQKKIQLHHHTYDRLGCELFTDVTPLCRFHHKAVHAWLKESKRIFVEYTGEAIAFLRGVPITTIQPIRIERSLTRKKKKCTQKAPKPNVDLLKLQQEKTKKKNTIQVFGKPRIKSGPPVKSKHDGANSWKEFLKGRCKA